MSLVIAKLAVHAGAAPLSLLTLSMLGAGVVLLGKERWNQPAPVLNRRVLEYGLVAGLLFALPNAIGFLAVAHVGAGFLSLTFAFPILLTYALALLLGMDRFHPRKALGVALGLSGGCLLALTKVSTADAPFFWVGLSSLSPILIALGNIYRTRRWPIGASPTYLAAIMLLGGGLLLAPFSLAWSVSGLAALFPSPTAWGLLVAQMALFSLLYSLYFLLQHLAGPVYLSQIGSVAAVIGGAIAINMLGETAPEHLLAAAGLIGCGTVLFQYQPGTPRSPSSEKRATARTQTPA
ncbi:EamA/RhaT family transporter [Hydrogenophaga sp.]|uniref:EamA/RhaT family transporter n=1 Tax=Hydrogenophaga sp. TaxID=1904254 RepID=UPI003562693E